MKYCVYFSDLGNTSTENLACYPATARHRLWQRRRQRRRRGGQCSSDRRHKSQFNSEYD